MGEVDTSAVNEPDERRQAEVAFQADEASGEQDEGEDKTERCAPVYKECPVGNVAFPSVAEDILPFELPILETDD